MGKVEGDVTTGIVHSNKWRGKWRPRRKNIGLVWSIPRQRNKRRRGKKKKKEKRNMFGEEKLEKWVFVVQKII